MKIQTCLHASIAGMGGIMKILYLCTVDPPPPHSDYPRVLEFFDVLPEHLHPYNGRNHTENVMLFADRYTGPIMPELYDVAIAFLSERFLTDEKTLQFLKEAYSCFPDLIGIDLSDALTPELKMIARSYSKKLFSAMDARTFLENNFPDPDALSKQEAEELKISIETDGYQYLDDTIADLNEKVKSNKKLAYLCYWGSFLALIGILVFAIFCYGSVQATIGLDFWGLIQYCGEIVVISALAIALSRFLFLLGKSFMVEAIRCSDRAHAIGLGRLYLKLFKSKFEWSELKDVLQSWNIDQGSAFRNLDAKDIEVSGFDQIISALRKQ